MKFCPKCGKKGIRGEFCSECSGKELQLMFKDIVVTKCFRCDRFLVKNRWLSYPSVNEGILSAAYTRIKNPDKVLLEIKPKYEMLKDKPGAEQDIELEITAENSEFVIPAKILFTYCEFCAKVGSEYFEGVLQLRNAAEDALAFVRKDIADHSSEGVHLVKETGHGGDFDFKLTSAKYLRALGKRLAQNFNGELTETSRLFSKNRMTGKEVHRVSVLFKLRGHKVGNIVDHKGMKVKVRHTGKHVQAVDIRTGKRIFLK
jgi:NMD protein affecting ribosome stability and mRNA decay